MTLRKRRMRQPNKRVIFAVEFGKSAVTGAFFVSDRQWFRLSQDEVNLNGSSVMASPRLIAPAPVTFA